MSIRLVTKIAMKVGVAGNIQRLVNVEVLFMPTLGTRIVIAIIGCSRNVIGVVMNKTSLDNHKG